MEQPTRTRWAEYARDEISPEIVHVVPQVAARLSSGVDVLFAVLARYEVDERRVAEVCNAGRCRVVVLQRV